MRLRAQLVYFIVTGQVIGFATEMILPYAMSKLMPKAKKMLHKEDGTEVEQRDEKEEATASEARIMKKIHREVALPDYNIYTDYVEMVIQVRCSGNLWAATS